MLQERKTKLNTRLPYLYFSRNLFANFFSGVELPPINSSNPPTPYPLTWLKSLSNPCLLRCFYSSICQPLLNNIYARSSSRRSPEQTNATSKLSYISTIGPWQASKQGDKQTSRQTGRAWHISIWGQTCSRGSSSARKTSINVECLFFCEFPVPLFLLMIWLTRERRKLDN